MVNKKLICTLLLATMLVTGCSGGQRGLFPGVKWDLQRAALFLW